MAKKLKIWNGRGQGKFRQQPIYVAAFSQKQAVELLNKACGTVCITLHELRGFYSPCWGIAMNGIEPTEPCIYTQSDWNTPVKRII